MSAPGAFGSFGLSGANQKRTVVSVSGPANTLPSAS